MTRMPINKKKSLCVTICRNILLAAFTIVLFSLYFEIVESKVLPAKQVQPYKTLHTIYERQSENKNMFDLVYAKKLENGQWEKTIVEKDIDIEKGKGGSLIIDKKGIPHILYGDLFSFEDFAIKYATYVGKNGNCGPDSDWICSVVLRGGGYFPNFPLLELGELVLTPDGRPSFVYTREDPGKKTLEYATYVGSSNGNCGENNDWDCQVVDTFHSPFGGTSVGPSAPALVIDAQKIPHISYYSFTELDPAISPIKQVLKYATYVQSGGNCGPSHDWDCIIIDDDPTQVGGVGGSSTSIMIDKQNVPHISYTDNIFTGNLSVSGSVVKYATLVNSGGNCGVGLSQGRWNCEIAATVTPVGWSYGGTFSENDITVDKNDIPHISYHYFCQVCFSWGRITLVENVRHAARIGTGGNCGLGASLGAWYCEIVNSEPAPGGIIPPYLVGEHNAIAVDEGQTIHMTYLTVYYGIKYATHVGAGGNCPNNPAWNCTVVDPLATAEDLNDLVYA